MRTEVVMPQMGESVTEGTITAWFKQVGDRVERDEPLFEITSDKVDAEIPSPAEGVVVKLLAEVGQTVEINTVVAILDAEGVIEDAPAAEAAPAPVTTPAPAAAAAAPAASASTTEAAPGSLFASPEADADAEALRRTRSTPLVRKIAAEHGIDDLSAISGSGLSGRVTRKDIMAYIDAGAPAAAPTPAPAAAAPARAAVIAQAPVPAAPVKPLALGERDTIEGMTPQRLAIAKHMVESRRNSPHAHTVHEIDFGAVFAARKALKAEFEARGVKLTFTAFMVKAAADALRAFPLVNSVIDTDGQHVIGRGDLNIGVAVALDDSLIVPVIRNVDELSLLGISRAIQDMSERARTKRLKPDEVRGGTFTLSNHGVFGPEFGIPIINQPQSAILATGAIKKRVVVDQKTDAIMVRPTAIFCMSFDHRLIDGATADRFLAHMRQTLEGWSV